MAVHLISLQRLAQQREHKATTVALPPMPRPALPAPHAEAPVIEVATIDDHEDPCGLTADEVTAFVEARGTDDGKTLLGLLYRISALEQQVSELRLERDNRPVAAPRTQRPTSVSRATPQGGPKNSVLEQIFRNNLLLWNSMDPEP